MRKPASNTAIKAQAMSDRRAASLLLMSRYTRSQRPVRANTSKTR